jgi:nucleotide-binding universal stress UspA family protein
MYKSILVPVDGSKLSYSALDEAGELCRALGAALTVVTSNPAYPTVIAGDGYMVEPITPKQWQASVQARDERVAKDVAKRLKGLPHTFVAVSSDQPYEGILHMAKKRKCDLIVMASHGRRGLAALILGSETTKVLTHSKIPVLVCR